MGTLQVILSRPGRQSRRKSRGPICSASKRYWPLSDPEQVERDKARYDAGFKPHSAGFARMIKRSENIKH